MRRKIGLIFLTLMGQLWLLPNANAQPAGVLVVSNQCPSPSPDGTWGAPFPDIETAISLQPDEVWVLPNQPGVPYSGSSAGRVKKIRPIFRLIDPPQSTHSAPVASDSAHGSASELGTH